MPRTPQVKGLGLVRKSGKPEIGLRVLRVSRGPSRASRRRGGGPSRASRRRGGGGGFKRDLNGRRAQRSLSLHPERVAHPGDRLHFDDRQDGRGSSRGITHRARLDDGVEVWWRVATAKGATAKGWADAWWRRAARPAVLFVIDAPFAVAKPAVLLRGILLREKALECCCSRGRAGAQSCSAAPPKYGPAPSASAASSSSPRAWTRHKRLGPGQWELAACASELRGVAIRSYLLLLRIA